MHWRFRHKPAHRSAHHYFLRLPNDIGFLRSPPPEPGLVTRRSTTRRHPPLSAAVRSRAGKVALQRMEMVKQAVLHFSFF
jgi:hypothetical protein